MAQAVDRTLDILEALAQAHDDVSLSRLGARVGLPLGTLHRLLATLIRRGYAAQNPETQCYGPGPKLLEVASWAARSERFNLRRIARPYLQQLTLATRETSNLAITQDGDTVYVDQVASPRLVRMFTEIGQRAPVYCTGTGKAILSGCSAAELEGYLATARFERWTPNTITDPQDLRAEIDRARLCGFAVDNEEREAGVRCVAAPIFNGTGACIAAISISGPTTRLDLADLADLGHLVRHAAERCSADLGHGVMVTTAIAQ